MFGKSAKGKIIGIFFILLESGSSLCKAEIHSGALLDSLAAHYRRLIPFEVTFELKVVGADDAPLKGSFRLEPKGCFAVFFADQEVHFDGQWLWSYSKSNRQVVVEEFQPSTSLQTIYDLLHGAFGNFTVSRVVPVKNQAQLKQLTLTSRTANALFQKMELWIDYQAYRIVRAEYLDFQNNRWRIEFGPIKPLTSQNLQPFTIPAGVELIDLRPKEPK